MRIKVIGDNPTANGLRGLLQHEKFQLVDRFPTYTIDLIEDSCLKQVQLDSVDSDFERCILNSISELNGSVLLVREGSNRDDTKVIIRLPNDDVTSWKVQQGIIRGLIQRAAGEKKWWSR